VPAGELGAAAGRLATIVAASPTLAVQARLKAV
jgi:hypothetical protein